MNETEMTKLAEEAGFSHSGIVDAKLLSFREEVRDMCAADKCHSYGKCWTCPPGCGSLAAVEAKAKTFRKGILLQITENLEDPFDAETMLEAEEKHKIAFEKMVATLREGEERILPMSVGACRICEKCTYPDAPCRFPERAIPSMESYGLVVSDTCKSAGLSYYYGPLTITYTGLILF